MNKNFKVQAQGGFTLIELIVVIVILGILAATALPKFANLSGDARFASINAAKGAMTSAAAIAHGRALVSPVDISNGNMTLEGTSIAVTPAGYPKATLAGIAAAANIAATDYTSYTANGTGIPTVPTNGIVFVPNSIAGTATAVKCFISYAVDPASKTDAPVVAVTGNATDCQ